MNEKDLAKEIATIMNEKFESINEKFDNMERKLNEIQNSVTDIKLTIENELRRNISIVAENHTDLYRNFKTAIDYQTKNELDSLRINILESKVRDLEQKIS